MSHTARRVAHALRERLAEILARRVSDPRLAGATITDVELSPDLSFARVYYRVSGAEGGSGGARGAGESSQEPAAAAAALESARGFIRRELARGLTLRRVPELRFVWDGSLERGNRVEALLREVGVADAPGDESEGRPVGPDTGSSAEGGEEAS